MATFWNTAIEKYRRSIIDSTIAWLLPQNCSSLKVDYVENRAPQ